MSRDIHMMADMGGLETEFIVPHIGETADLEFYGLYVVEAINDNGEMRITGRGKNGHGETLYIEEGDVKFNHS